LLILGQCDDFFPAPSATASTCFNLISGHGEPECCNFSAGYLTGRVSGWGFGGHLFRKRQRFLYYPLDFLVRPG